jgi:hypothetical protein
MIAEADVPDRDPNIIEAYDAQHQTRQLDPPVVGPSIVSHEPTGL